MTNFLTDLRRLPRRTAQLMLDLAALGRELRVRDLLTEAVSRQRHEELLSAIRSVDQRVTALATRAEDDGQ